MSIDLNITAWIEAHELPCLIKTVFHVDCPTCGLQRSVVSLLKGNVGESYRFYPPLFFIIFFFVLFFVNKQFRIFSTQNYIRLGVPSIFMIILVFYIHKLITLN